MKQRNLKKKVGSLLLAAAMVVTSFPSYSKEVHAAGNTLPDVSQFATVDELKKFNTDDNDGEINAAKVYFGKNSQQWWIAGSQSGIGLTLFAASPLATKQQFATNWQDPIPYDKEWNCTYPNGEPTEVDPNHYGASPLRKILKDMETSYFTGAEQRWMKDTTIYTQVTKESDKTFYSTTDKLYLSYGRYPNYGTDYVSVGANSEDAPESGLHVDNKYWTDSTFWLRMVVANISRSVAVGVPSSKSVGSGVVTGHFDVVPAFELDLSAVSFASAAPAASSEGDLAIQDTDGDGAFTLRYKSPSEIGTATVSQSKQSVAVTGVTNEDTYLVVQNKDGAWSKKVADNDLVFADEMAENLTSFENCKVWLETTNERITYASEANYGNGNHVSVVGGEGLNVTGGIQTNVIADISDITVEVADGYYLPDTYIGDITGLNGLTVTETDTGFKISGTPASDVKIILPPATPLPKSDTPVVEWKATSTSITVTVTNYREEFGDIEYKWDDGSWEKDKNTLSDLEPNTTHQLAVRYKGDGFYQASDEYTVTITTLQDGNTVVIEPENVTAIYSVGLKLADVRLPEGWVWVEGETALSAGTGSYPAAFDTTAYEAATDFSEVDGYDKDTKKVTRKIEVKVAKAESEVKITTQSLDKVYDGTNAVNAPEYTRSGSDGKVTITWKKNTGTSDTPNWEDLKSAPSAAGNYQVVVELAGNDNYNSASATLSFVISQATNSWEEELSITGWIYNGIPGLPSAKAQFGDVTFTYSNEENGTYTNEVPKNAGTYYVKAGVTGTENYTSLESVVSFIIAKAGTTLTFEKENIDKTYDKNAISEPKVTKNGSGNDIVFEWYIADENGWQKLDNAPSDVGAYKVVAGVTEDANYNGASIEKEFAISIADNEWTKELSIKDWTYGETASVPSAAAKYGDVVYTYSDSADGAYTSDVPVNAGTWYVKASVTGAANYTGLESAPVEFEITKAAGSVKFKEGVTFDKSYDTNAVAVTEEHIERTGGTGAVRFTFEKKADHEWQSMNESPIVAGTYRVTADLAGDNNHTSAVSIPLEFTISKADSQVYITTQSFDKVYDGNAVGVPEYTTAGSDGETTISWKKNTGTAERPNWEESEKAPSTAGNYQVVVTLAENDNYNSASATLGFVISQIPNVWTEELSITGWTYNEKPNTPNAKAQYGDTAFTYNGEENGTYTNEVPQNAGTWYVKASVAEGENYTGLESAPAAFVIAKAVPVPEKVTGLVLGQGQPLSKIKLPEQFKWVDETLTANVQGTHTFKAVYTPEDTANYETIEVEIAVEVAPTPADVNHVPTISVKDKIITVGDKFEPLKDVTASDKEDGDLTPKIKVIDNTVNTKKAGIYEVTYQVTDSQGASVTKTSKVTVKAEAASVDPDEDKSDDKGKSDKDKSDNAKAAIDKEEGSVETGDGTNLFLWEVLLLGSSVILIHGLYRKKRKMK